MADQDDLIISISTDLTSVKRQLNKLVGDVGSASDQISRKFSTTGQGIDKSMTTALQARINDVVGIGQQGVKEWNGALADQGKQLEQLRAKYNPLYAAITQYKAAVAEIKTANGIGAISADEMTTAIQRQRQAALASIDAIKKRNAAVVDTPAAKAGSNHFQTANIAAQFQDIAVQSALGQSPLQIALEQGTQLSSAFGESGAAGAVKALGAGFLSLVSPVSLVTIGLVAGTAALIEYVSNSKSKIPDVDDILKAHQANIEKLGPAYKEVLDQQQKYVRDSQGLANLRAQGTANDATKRQIADASAGYEAIMRVIAQYKIAVAEAAQSDPGIVNRYDFAPAQKAIDALGASIKSGVPQVREFQEAVNGLKQSGAISDAVALQLLNLTKAGLDTSDSLSKISPTINALAASFQTASDQLGNLPFGDMRTKLEQLVSEFQSGKTNAADFTAQAQVLEQSYPTYSGWIQSLANIITQLEQARDTAKDLNSYVNVGTDLQKGGRNAAMDALKARMATIGQDENFFIRSGGGNDLADKLKSQAKTYESDHKVKKTPDVKKTADDRINEDIQAIRDRSAALQQEIGLVGLSYEEQTKRRTELDLEQKALKDLREEARKKGQTDLDAIKLSPERIAQIQSESAAYAAQADALRKVQESHEKAQEAASEFYDTFKSDTIDALTGAKSLSDALGDIAKKLGDMLLNEAFDSLFKPATDTSSGGQFGGIFSSIGKWITSGFDAGGYTGLGGKFQPAGVVHKGEYVIPKEMVDKIGLKGIQAMLGSYSAGGLVGGPRMPSIMPRAANDNAAITYAPVIDARGADAAAVARIQETLARDKAEFASKVVTTMRVAQKTRNWKG
ncbi:hypothetical protein DTW90_30675 [Neorhizobium sp. P12A]|uniref:phage tail length tape measure family protein n=1 Tax=Neorhizobium sp. P12A TaxID=2268027 RepID=UPI0011EF1618|nr:phage tail length tape measure family protein [Neorhizobium sp. P12A]KAA0689859.1 hypothetical protein DTW90_30675 [Neorhizobium sp. P12A]